jgi:hypothetical protein
MATTVQTRTPVHLWIVGIVSLLWNAFGAYDYLMTRTKGAPYIDSMMHTDQGSAIMAYIDSFPIWVSAAWGCGVWGGVAGSILLLMRSRHAVAAFAVSTIGAIFGLGWQILNPSGIAEMSETVNKVIPYVIIAVALGLFLYARALQQKGMLR